MIYGVNFLDLAAKLNPLAVCKYLEQTGWKKFPFKRTDVNVYQNITDERFAQITVPLNRLFADYNASMYNVVQEIAKYELKDVEQIMLYLLNPNADILKIRMENKDIEAGNIQLDDAIRLYDNAKKLLAATALDILNPKKVHYGRVDDSVQAFLNNCRFGQTEVGSYVVSVVCPLADWSEKQGYKQLSLFSDEESCENSLTRKVTRKLVDNIALIKDKIDQGAADELLAEDNGISSNFLEALNGLNSPAKNTVVDFIPEWAPTVKSNRSNYTKVSFTSDYYQPITSIVERIKGISNQRFETVGRIKQLSAAPTVDKRRDGLVVVVFLDDNDKAKSVTIKLSKEDYEKALTAHQFGKYVKVVGDLTGKNKLKMNNVIFSVVD